MKPQLEVASWGMSLDRAVRSKVRARDIPNLGSWGGEEASSRGLKRSSRETGGELDGGDVPEPGEAESGTSPNPTMAKGCKVWRLALDPCGFR